MHPLIGAAITSSSPAIELACLLTASQRLAYLRDHVIMGRSLLPATATMELMLAASHVLFVADSSADSEGLQTVIVGMAIHAPVVFPKDAELAASLCLSCTVDVYSGALGVAYKHGPRQQVHSASAYTSVMLLSGYGKSAQSSLQAPKCIVQHLRQQAKYQSSTGMSESHEDGFGSVRCFSEVWQASGYLTYPPETDSALHLGVLAPGKPARIPIACACFKGPAAPNGRDTGAKMASAAVFAHPGSGSDARKSFWLCDDAMGGGSTACCIYELETATMTAQQGVLTTGASSEEASPSTSYPTSYEVAWLASTPTAENGAGENSAWLDGSCDVLGVPGRVRSSGTWRLLGTYLAQPITRG